MSSASARTSRLHGRRPAARAVQQLAAGQHGVAGVLHTAADQALQEAILGLIDVGRGAKLKFQQLSGWISTTQPQ